MLGQATRLFLTAMALIMALAPAAMARSGSYITAYSDYGNGIVRGPIRHGPYGLQVKLPNGPWIDCTKSGLIFRRHHPCSETLRRETVDFWESQQEDHGGRR